MMPSKDSREYGWVVLLGKTWRNILFIKFGNIFGFELDRAPTTLSQNTE